MIIVGTDPEARQNNLPAAFQIVAAAMLEFGLNVAITFQEIRQFIFRHRQAHGRFDLLNLQAELHNGLGSGHNFLKSRTAGHGPHILRKITADGMARLRNFPGIKGLLAHDQTKDAGFAGPVRPNQTTAASGQDLKTGIPKQDLRTVLLADAAEMNHKS